MRVRSVKYERLFSFEKYNNERIGMEIELSEHDDAAAVLGELYFKILNIEKSLELFRFFQEKFETIVGRIESRNRRRKELLEDIRITEKELEKIKQIQDETERARRLCNLRDIKDLRRRLVEVEEEIEELEELRDKTRKALNDLEKMIKAGQFEEALEKYRELSEKLAKIYNDYY